MGKLPVAADKMQWNGVTVTIGPAMQALPTDKMRLFVLHLCLSTKRGFGSRAQAARLAGYGTATTTAKDIGSMASALCMRDDIREAIAEMMPKMIGALGPAAVNAVARLIDSPGHKQHFQAVNAILERVAPTQTLIKHEVTHIDRAKEAVDELTRLERAGFSDDELIAKFDFTAASLFRIRQRRGDVMPALKNGGALKVINVEAEVIDPADELPADFDALPPEDKW